MLVKREKIRVLLLFTCMIFNSNRNAGIINIVSFYIYLFKDLNINSNTSWQIF